MKKIFLFFALASVTIFTACNKQYIGDDIVLVNHESTPLTTNNLNNLDLNNTLIDSGKANFVINNENNIVSEKNDLLLTNNSTNAISYEWDFGNGDTSRDANPNYNYKIHGNYTVTLTITDSNGYLHKTSNDILVLCVFGGGQHDQ